MPSKSNFNIERSVQIRKQSKNKKYWRFALVFFLLVLLGLRFFLKSNKLQSQGVEDNKERTSRHGQRR